MEIVVLWLILAIAVGALANSRGRSGVGFFLLSAILSPLLGLIVVLVMSDLTAVEKKDRERQAEHEKHLESIKAIAQPRGGGTSSLADELSKLAELKERGVLTAPEFEAQKRALLGGEVAR